jgi:hypothetical protein
MTNSVKEGPDFSGTDLASFERIADRLHYAPLTALLDSFRDGISELCIYPSHDPLDPLHG